MNNSCVYIFFIFTLMFVKTGEISIKADFNATGETLKHFWKSTGFCPPDPKTRVEDFLLSQDVKLNLAYIGALPARGIKHVRIHWLLNLITTRSIDAPTQYNFSYLDTMLDRIYDQKLFPGFEVMGLPLNTSNFKSSYTFWYNITNQIVERYIERYGFNYVQKWRFETWNEPDLKNYNILDFNLKDYLDYIRAIQEVLEHQSRNTSKKLRLGGPAGVFKDMKRHPLCWGLLRQCNKRNTQACPVQFISFHKKGDGNAGGVLNNTIELLNVMYSEFPNVRHLSMANDEADILTNWSKSEEWRGDVRYAAMMVKVIIDYFKKLVIGKKLKIEVLSNDNGFLNYHPYYFTQRTLLARFQMNNSIPSHIQFIKKPAYLVMGLLSLLGDKYLKEDIVSPDPFVEFLMTRSRKSKHKSQTTTLLISYANNTIENNKTKQKVNVVFNNLPDLENKYMIYVLDNHVTNPFLLWKNAGSPVFPTKGLREQMRIAGEPFRHYGPSVIVNSSLEVKMNLTLPTVALIHVCSKNSVSPGRVTHLKAYNVTRNEVLLVWKDTRVYSKCILTYEVEFHPELKTNNSTYYVRVNSRDIIFLSYHHVATDSFDHEATRGSYRIRAVDYWNRAGRYSKSLRYP